MNQNPSLLTVETCLDLVGKLEDYSVKQKRFRDVIPAAHALREAVVQIMELQEAFLDTPRCRVDGEGGVADKVGLGKNGVYVRIEKLGLRPDDFVDVRSSLNTLLSRSSTVQNLYQMATEQLTTFEAEAPSDLKWQKLVTKSAPTASKQLKK